VSSSCTSDVNAKMLTFLGHVDHGKSTLMGRLLCDMKVVDQRSLDKLRKEAETIGKSSFALAWVMDQTAEERSRGVTVDIATSNFETETTRFTILDAPGHRDFIPNMIAGASQADFAVLVIDASINSFESGLKGQTKEHALLVRSMGVQRLVVAVNKMDTISWDQRRFEEISQQMTTFLTTASFQSKSITFVPLAGLTGENVVKKVSNPKASWYTGESLVEALDSSNIAKRNLAGPLRMTINDVFRGGITNPVSISGRIDTGTLQVGDVILCQPAGESAAVKAIEVESEPVDWAVAGQIPTLHLADIDPVHLRSGDIVCDLKNPVKLINSFSCKILAFDHVLPMSVEVFRGRLQAEGKIKRLVATLNKTTGETIKAKPRIVKPGEVARVLVDLSAELPLEPGTRIVLREGGNTVAAGLLEA
jgi:elongation factor 1 alpha-like protein